MFKKMIKFIKELIPSIVIGMLLTSLYANYKLLDRATTSNAIDMPYSLKVEGSGEGIIRDARSKVTPSKTFKVEEF